MPHDRLERGMNRLWSKVRKTDDCWWWTSSKDTHGYGQIWYQGRARSAYRVLYEMAYGPVPAGLELDHLCRNRLCVRPAHLEAVTHKENMLRGAGVGSQNAAKTHCLAGHPFDAANTAPRSGGGRYCRACGREATRRYLQRKKLGRP